MIAANSNAGGNDVKDLVEDGKRLQKFRDKDAKMLSAALRRMGRIESKK